MTPAQGIYILRDQLIYFIDVQLCKRLTLPQIYCVCAPLISCLFLLLHTLKFNSFNFHNLPLICLPLYCLYENTAAKPLPTALSIPWHPIRICARRKGAAPNILYKLCSYPFFSANIHT